MIKEQERAYFQEHSNLPILTLYMIMKKKEKKYFKRTEN